MASSGKAVQSKLRSNEVELTRFEEFPYFALGSRQRIPDRIRVMLEFNEPDSEYAKLIYRYVSEPSDVLIDRSERKQIGAEAREPSEPGRAKKERADIL